MKKWTILIILSLFVGSFITSAQIFAGKDIIIRQTDEISKKEVEHPLPSANGVLRTLKPTKNGYYIVEYDEVLRPIGKPKRFEAIPVEAKLRTIQEFNGELLVIYVIKVGRSVDETVHVGVVSKEDFSIIIKPSKILDETFDDFVFYKMSPDRTKLILYKRSFVDKGIKFTVREMYDDFEFESPYEIMWPEEERIYKTKFWINDAGAIFLEAIVYTNEPDYRDRTSSYVMYKYNENGMPEEVFRHEDVDEYLNTGQHYVKRNGNVVFYGTHSENDKKEDPIKGVFYAEYDWQTGDLIASKYSEIDQNFLALKIPENLDFKQAHIYKHANDRKRGIVLRGCVERSNGNVVIILEHVWKYTWSTEQQEGIKLNLFDVLVIGFDSVGQIDWKQKIEKAQYAMEWTSVVRPPVDLDWNSLTHYCMVDDRLDFYFIVDGCGMPDLNYTKTSPYDRYTNSHLVRSSITVSNGDKSVESLGMIEKNQFIPRFRDFSKYENETITFKSRTKKAYRLGVITFD